MTVEVGGIWVDHETSVQVYDVNDRAVFFRYLHGTPAGLLDAIGTMSVVSFEQRYTEVDVFEAQNPKVKPGQEWWNRRSPRHTVTVVSVLNDVVTYRYNTGLNQDDYAADAVDKFIANFTSTVSAPKDTTDISEWPTHALFRFNEQSNTLHYHSWTVAERQQNQVYPDMALLKVPIDWSQATWEVEPL